MMEQNTTIALLTRTFSEVGPLELERFRAFFGMRGMVANFIEDHPEATYTRKQVDNGIKKNSFRGDVLGDMRDYLAKHKNGFAGLLPILAMTEEQYAERNK